MIDSEDKFYIPWMDITAKHRFYSEEFEGDVSHDCKSVHRFKDGAWVFWFDIPEVVKSKRIEEER